jgi:hypothetical protein
VYDFDLQLRFWRGVTDAYWHGTEAALAASQAWRDEVLSPKVEAKKPAPPPFPLMDLTLWGWPAPNAKPSTASSAVNPFMVNPFTANPFMANPFMNMMPWVEIFWRQSMEAWPKSQPTWNGIPQPNFPAMLMPFWGWAATPWGFMQTPLTAMMMNAGFPYTVASPSAKAGTAAMDAADAARQQMEKVFSAYRSDGGHAAAQLMSMPWSIATSFMTVDKKPGWAAR